MLDVRMRYTSTRHLALADRRLIVPVLNNLFSNASRHSSETLPIRVSAVQDALHVAISMYRKRSFATGGRGRLPASAAVCRIPCLILCLAYVERKRTTRS